MKKSLIPTNSFLNKLPPDMAEDPFWRISHKESPSTFGAAHRKLDQITVDDPFKIEKDYNKWIAFDKHQNNHGRMQVITGWGKFATAPPVLYKPDHEKLSYRETFPAAKVLFKPKDKYFEEVKYCRKHPIEPLGSATILTMGQNNRSINVSSPSNGGRLHSLNLDDMRQRLLPGPGAYEFENDLRLKFHDSNQKVMGPKSKVGRPRPVMAFETLQVIKDRNANTDATYNIVEEPSKRKSQIRKSIQSHPIGARRPDHTEREYIRMGPGDYDEGRGFRFGSPSIVSASKARPKGVNLATFKQGLSSHTFGRKELL